MIAKNISSCHRFGWYIHSSTGGREVVGSMAKSHNDFHAVLFFECDTSQSDATFIASQLLNWRHLQEMTLFSLDQNISSQTLSMHLIHHQTIHQVLEVLGRRVDVSTLNPNNYRTVWQAVGAATIATNVDVRRQRWNRDVRAWRSGMGLQFNNYCIVPDCTVERMPHATCVSRLTYGTIPLPTSVPR